MTDILPWLIANWLIIGIVAAVALAFLILLIAGMSWAFSWYMRRLVLRLFHEVLDEPLPHYPFGDSPHLPDGYWEAVARKEAKQRAA